MKLEKFYFFKKPIFLIFFYCVVLPVLCFPNVRKGITSHIPQFLIDLLRGRNGLGEAFENHSGSWVLPHTVFKAKQLLEEFHAQEFALSPQWMQSDELKQRAIEGLFPIRYNPRFKVILFMSSEQIPARCQVLTQSQSHLQSKENHQEEVVLVFCP